VLLADVQHILALAPILPSFDLYSNAGATLTESSQVSNQTLVVNGVPIQIMSGGTTNTSAAFNMRLQATQLIFDGGRWWMVLAQADDVSAQAKATLRKMQNDVRQAAARAFYNVEKAARSVSTFAAQVKLDTEQLERVNAMLRAGAGKPADVAAVE